MGGRARIEGVSWKQLCHRGLDECSDNVMNEEKRWELKKWVYRPPEKDLENEAIQLAMALT